MHHRFVIILESQAILRPGPGSWEENAMQSAKDIATFWIFKYGNIQTGRHKQFRS